MKLITIFTICVVAILVQIFCVNNNVMAEEYYLIATGNASNNFAIYSLNEDIFKPHKTIKIDQISNFEWPNYNRVTQDIYFGGLSENPSRRTNFIYKYNHDGNPEVEQLVEGLLPSLSIDGKWLAYYRHPNQLWLLDLEKRHTTRIADDIAKGQPPVWISENRILYESETYQLIALDIPTGEKRRTGYEKITPGSLSPDGKTVLCSNFNGDKIILYSVDANTIETIKASRFLSIGSSFIWRPDGKSFLYTRQTWSNILKFLEMRDLFLFSIDKRAEKHLAVGMRLFGGFEIRDWGNH
jgi:hypothetical protein